MSGPARHILPPDYLGVLSFLALAGPVNLTWASCDRGSKRLMPQIVERLMREAQSRAMVLGCLLWLGVSLFWVIVGQGRERWAGWIVFSLIYPVFLFSSPFLWGESSTWLRCCRMGRYLSAAGVSCCRLVLVNRTERLSMSRNSVSIHTYRLEMTSMLTGL